MIGPFYAVQEMETWRIYEFRMLPHFLQTRQDTMNRVSVGVVLRIETSKAYFLSEF